MYKKRYINRGGSRGGRGGSARGRGGRGQSYQRGGGGQVYQQYAPRDQQQQQNYGGYYDQNQRSSSYQDSYYQEGVDTYGQEYGDYYDEYPGSSQQQMTEQQYLQMKKEQEEQASYAGKQEQTQYQSHRKVVNVESNVQSQQYQAKQAYQTDSLNQSQYQPKYQAKDQSTPQLNTQSSVFVPKKKTQDSQSYPQEDQYTATQQYSQPQTAQAKYLPKEQTQSYQKSSQYDAPKDQQSYQPRYQQKQQYEESKQSSYDNYGQPQYDDYYDSGYNYQQNQQYQYQDYDQYYQGDKGAEQNENYQNDQFYDDYYQEVNKRGLDDYGDYGNEGGVFEDFENDYYNETDTQVSRDAISTTQSQYSSRTVSQKNEPIAKDEQKQEKPQKKPIAQVYEKEKYQRGGKYQKPIKEQQDTHKGGQNRDREHRSQKERYQQEEQDNSQNQVQLNEISNLNYAQGHRSEHVNSPCVVMMVAEKPSIALSISEALSNNFVKKNGVAKQCPVYTFKGNFQGQQASFRVTSVAGHVYNRDFPLDYQDRRMDPKSLFEAPTVRRLDNSSRIIAKHLQAVSSGIDYMVLWLDCDKEGENICFEVLDICRRNIPSSKKQRVFRAKFSSIAKKDIQASFDALKFEPSYNESVSVEARQIMDLKIGVAFSRFQTQYFAHLLRGQSEIRMITYGPCQTPTLGFCVDQAEKIKKFIPEPYWSIETVIGDRVYDKTYYLKWQRGKIYDRTITSIIHARILGIQTAEVIDIKKSNAVQGKPQGLNTVKMLKVASKTYGMSAHDTMKIAEHLYLRGFITYPRTESTTYSSNFNFKEILTQHMSHPDWGNYAQMLLNGGMVKPKKGVDAGDHPPITPVKSATKSQLGDREWRLYNFISRNFFGSISHDASYEQVKVLFQVGQKDSVNEIFKLKGNILKEEGFLEVMPWLLQSDKEIPVYKMGQQVDIKAIRITEGKTQAPGYLTEAKLISQMEKHGIGTDASIPTHINNIIERKFVTVLDPGRQLVPTPLGLALVKGYCQIDPELVLPSIRQNIEKSCELIAKGKADFNKILSHVLNMFKKKFEFFRANIISMEKILALMLKSSRGLASNEFLLSNKIKHDDSSDFRKTALNFCIKCFKGHLHLQFHSKKGWGLKCYDCNFRIGVLQGAARVLKEDKKCDECDSYLISATYTKDSPFPGKRSEHTGCILCDSLLNSTIITFLSKKPKKLPEEMNDEERKIYEEKKKKMDDKKKAKELRKIEEAKQDKTKKDESKANEEQKKKNKKKKGGMGNQMTQQELMNEFIKKQLQGN
ncbi:dna topoisomerase 3-beta-1-like [Stylonychia lemnae]|uniref:DNA topoisomerase n=1 Tax=Stylonychia lemnae TaxID=5949 RepID=A0A078B952_STYLE|nr:dna topoisomerase 3-beta-1-like [Stylonychia lemnae]|eukprot:CDW89802.1 dna topoisomerase 3-beta-1-like [Stylonychia lemnae]